MATQDRDTYLQSGQDALPAAARRFHLLRYFIVTSLLVVVTLVVVVAFFFVRKAESDFAERSTSRGAIEAGHIVSLFHHNVWSPRQFGSSQPNLASVIDPPLLDDFFQRTTFGLNIIGLSILDRDGAVLWRNDPASVGQTTSNEKAFANVVRQGTYWSGLLKDQPAVGANPGDDRLDLIRTYYPLRDVPPDAAREGGIVGVLEMRQDVTSELATARRDTLILPL